MSFVGRPFLWHCMRMLRALALLSLIGSIAHAEVVVPIVATAEVKGTTEPCGCNSDPLGDVARVVKLAAGGLLVDAGGLLYDRETLTQAKQPQADAKANALASIYARAAVGLGPDDLARGVERVKPPRLAANASGVPIAPPRVFTVGGVKIGVFGVVSPERVSLGGVKAGEPRAAAEEAIQLLRRDGAQVIVALLGMPRPEARALLRHLDGVWFGVVGADVGEGTAEAEPVGDAFLVAPADQGRRVARLELHVVGGKPARVLFGGEAARRAQLDRVAHKIETLKSQLAGWRNDPNADKAFVKARADELADLETQRIKLEHEKPAPPSTSYFTYTLVPVKRQLLRDAEVAATLQKLDREIGRVNLAAAAKTPPPAEPGRPSYVGTPACAKCHKPAVELWKKTVHAKAWKTLVDVDKQYNYDCISCHVTGWERPGGSNLGTAEKLGLVDVQCEVCHGPGSKHVAEAGLDDPPTLTRKPADRFCADNCHTPEHSDTFQLVPYLRDILGRGHGEKRRGELGEGPTGHELRTKALRAAGR
jgi:hypothetical protein